MTQADASIANHIPKNNAGRPKGATNKIPKDLVKSIMDAYYQLGGVEYLVEIGTTNPKIFLTLLSKIVPRDTNVNIEVAKVKSLSELYSSLQVVEEIVED